MNRFRCILLLSLAMPVSSQLWAQHQVHKEGSKSRPEVTLNPDGSYKVCVEGFLTDKEAARFAASVGKAGSKTNATAPPPAAVKNKTKASSDKEGKIIHYGCWRMQNNLKTQSDSMMQYLSYGVTPHRPLEAKSGNRQLRTIDKPVDPSILKLSPSNSTTGLSVVKGAPYAVQVAPFDITKYTPATLQKMSSLTAQPIIMVQNRGKCQLLIEGFPGLKEAGAVVNGLSRLGFHGSIVRREH